MQTRLAALLPALLFLGACEAPFVVPTPSVAPGVPSPSVAPGVPSFTVPVAPHAEDPSIGPDPTVLPTPDESDLSPIAPDIELATPGPDPTVPAGKGLDATRYR
jgi:hypothetical protein